MRRQVKQIETHRHQRGKDDPENDPCDPIGSHDASAGGASFRLNRFESDPLGQGQLDSPVDGAGLTTHVNFPGIRPGFSAAPRIFLASESPSDFGSGRTHIDVGNPAIASHLG